MELKRIPQELHKEDGAAAVEFAVVLPGLALLLLGMMQFGILFHYYLQITHAAREGVRWASLEKTVAEVESKTMSAAPSLQPALTSADIKVFVNDVEVTDPASGATIQDQGLPAKVSVSYAVPIFIPLMQNFLGSTFTLVSAATQRVE